MWHRAGRPSAVTMSIRGLLLCSLSFCLVLAKDITVDLWNVNYIYLNGSGPVNISQSCKEKACISKCCPPNHILLKVVEGTPATCVSNKDLENDFGLKSLDDYSNVEIYKYENALVPEDIIKSDKKIEDFTVLHLDRFPPNCTTERFYSETLFYFILEDGSMVVRKINSNNNFVKYNTSMFCLDLHVSSDKNGSLGSTTPGPLFYLGYCVDVPPPTYTAAVIIAWGMVVSSFFLILTLVVYALLPELRNLMGLMLMAYMATETVFFLFRVVHVLARVSEAIEKTGCIVMTFLVYYTMMSTHSWMNVMAFDIWWRIWYSLPYGVRKRRTLPVRFVWYSLYAWGLAPMVPTLLIVILDNLDIKDSGAFIRPHVLDWNNCFFNDETYFPYVIGPLTVMITVNLIFFTMTTARIWLIERDVNDINETHTNSPQYSFQLYLRLSLVMGVSYISIVLEQVIKNKSFAWVWHISDANYTLVGVFLFITFVCKKKIILSLCKKFSIDNGWVQRMRARGSSRTDRHRSTQHSDVGVVGINAQTAFFTPSAP